MINPNNVSPMITSTISTMYGTMLFFPPFSISHHHGQRAFHNPNWIRLRHLLGDYK